jgi:hypothetical protein
MSIFFHGVNNSFESPMFVADCLFPESEPDFSQLTHLSTETVDKRITNLLMKFLPAHNL